MSSCFFASQASAVLALDPLNNGYSYSNSVWKTTAPVVATVVAIIKNNSVAQWPAIGVRAWNFTNATDYAEVNGLA